MQATQVPRAKAAVRDQTMEYGLHPALQFFILRRLIRVDRVIRLIEHALTVVGMGRITVQHLVSRVVCFKQITGRRLLAAVLATWRPRRALLF